MCTLEARQPLQKLVGWDISLKTLLYPNNRDVFLSYQKDIYFLNGK